MDALISEFWGRAARSPEATFCHFVTPQGVNKLTWRAVGGRALTFCQIYRERGIPRRAVVLIFLPHSEHLYSAFLGAITADLIPSFMPCPTPKQDPALYWSSHLELLARIGPSCIVTDRATLAGMANAGLKIDDRVIVVEDIDVEACAPKVAEIEAARKSSEPDAIVLLQHSSGTTGLKKGVALSNENVRLQVDFYSKVLALAADDVVVSWLPLYHDMGLIACFVLPVMCGVPFVHLDAFHWLARPSILFDLIESHRGSLVWLPNFAFNHMANTVSVSAGRTWDLSTVRAVINCSEPCRATTFNSFAKKFSSIGLSAEKLHCCYAMAESVFAVSQTEMGVPATARRFDQDGLVPGAAVRVEPEGSTSGTLLLSCGAPIPGIAVEVRDENGNTLPAGAVGQLAIKGRFVFSGYFRNEELTEKRLRDGWYATQDLGFIYEGEIFVLGRLDDVIICNGKNILAHDVENIVNGTPGVKPGRCVAVPIEDDRAGSQKLVVIAEAETADKAELSRARSIIVDNVYAAVGVAPATVQFVPVGWMVKTTSGKTSRTHNRQKFLTEREQLRIGSL
jgi:acyl-CoA synthetase (AMP-forming)/AMP-acid ligase II